MDSVPPLQHHYGALVQNEIPPFHALGNSDNCDHLRPSRAVLEECELPLIDLSGLESYDESKKIACSKAISGASSEWGFFQVVNHGISPELLRRMNREQVKLFGAPFERKSSCGVLNNSYRWGTPTARYPNQFSWSEAFHIPLIKISDSASYRDFTSMREVMEELAGAMSKLARLLAGVLAENLGHSREVFNDICDESTCFLRLNHYPPCPVPSSQSEIFGLVPHTDSDFLTILFQDQVGGLQLMKDSKWVAVKPNQDALIVNIGDLFQAWSNNVYKSVEHKVMTNGKRERYTIAYFMCPSYDSLIGSCREPSIYKEFTFRDYRNRVQEDVKKTGYKTGLSTFLL